MSTVQLPVIDARYCYARNRDGNPYAPPYACTRRLGHEGRHHATTPSGRLVAVWGEDVYKPKRFLSLARLWGLLS